MVEDPGGLMNVKDAVHGVSFYLDLIEHAPSEHAKALIINEKLVPWIQSKGTLSFTSRIVFPQMDWFCYLLRLTDIV
jgi:hypothetical protein